MTATRVPHALRAALGRLRASGPGYVDRFDAERVAGWAVDPATPDRPARLSLHVDGVAVMNIAANLPRADVAASGRAPLNCGFDVPLPVRLRDGAKHLVEIRLGERGRRLRGGRLVIAARAGAAPTMEAAEIEGGVAWFDRARGAIRGWAAGATQVTVDFGTGTPLEQQLDREVPGFGAGTRPGFFVPVPAALADGRERSARLFAGSVELDGSPVRFRLGADRPLVRVVALSGGRVTLALSDATGAPTDRPVRAEADGVALPLHAEGRGRVTLDLPDAARHLVLSAGAPRGGIEGTTPEGTVLARYVIVPGRGLEDWSREITDPALDAARLPDGLCAAARDAHAAFLASRGHTGETSENAALPFDEAGARALHPAVARAVEEGRIPCAFALELALGAGALGTPTGLSHDARATLAAGRVDDFGSDIPPAPPAPRALPPATASAPLADSIYAAWLARLNAGPEARGAIEVDERALRRDIEAVRLLREPQVSIIMPSWNRAFTIGEAIQSVIEQSYPNWELLICDDASEDRTADVVRGFDDARIRYMRFLKSNGAGARNHGLRFARGEYIAYLDSDNIWHPLFLERMLRELLGHPGQPIAYSSYLDTEIEGAKVHLQEIARPAFRPVALSAKNFMDLNTIVHHRRVTDWMGGFDPRLPRLQDWDMVLRHTSVFGARHVDRIGVFYRRNIAWGQVTHTQIASGAQDTVNEKTRARLAGNHERIAPDWPARPRVTVLTGGLPGVRGAAERLLGESLARLAAAHGEVSLVDLGAPGAETETATRDGDPAGLTRITLPEALAADPARLAHALGRLLSEGVTLAAGLAPGLLEVLPGLQRARVLTLATAGETTALVRPGAEGIVFPLGAVPLTLPRRTGAAPARPEVLVLRPAGPDRGKDPWAGSVDIPALQLAARTHAVTLLLPPRGRAPWRRLDGTVETPLDDVLPDALGSVAAAAVLGPLDGLDPLDTALLLAAQAAGVPLAVPDLDAAHGAAAAPPGGFARQWIEARAAYAIRTPDADWVFEKLAKLIPDAGAMARMSERSHTAHAIAFHPALVRERVAHALWRLSVDPPAVEVQR